MKNRKNTLKGKDKMFSFFITYMDNVEITTGVFVGMGWVWGLKCVWGLKSNPNDYPGNKACLHILSAGGLPSTRRLVLFA